MKRLLGLALASLLTLSGCHRAVPGPSANTADKPKDASTTRSGAPAETSHPVVFAPETRNSAREEVPLLEQIDRENIKVVSTATPSIVRIVAERPADPHLRLFAPFPFHFGPGTSRDFRQNDPSCGSGVIISRDGYIVTNYHVLEDSKSVEVQLPDQRTFSARVVASDTPTDIAVLKIDATNLPTLPWGDSEKVEVGEQVFAIGNPFDLGDSVSKGIVSAKGRSLPNSTAYEDYIQTDAAINPGNSGGALINIHGELIGINAAIASTSRGNMGVGFSIPSNLVRYAVEGLLKDGKLVRGYLGVQLPASIDDGVTGQLGLDSDQGALLAGVQHSSPADLAQLQPVDFITEVDGHKIDSVAHLRLIVAQIPVGKKVVVNYIRAGTERSTTVEIAEAPKETILEGNEMPLPVNPDNGAPSHLDNVLDGLQVANLTDKTRPSFGVDDAVTSGVVISGVMEGSLADEKGLLRGDVIEIACAQRGLIQPLANTDDFTALTKKLKADQSLVLLVHHGKSSGPANRTSSFIYLSPQPK